MDPGFRWLTGCIRVLMERPFLSVLQACRELFLEIRVEMPEMTPASHRGSQAEKQQTCCKITLWILIARRWV